MLYQIEVKRLLAEHLIGQGYEVCLHVDPMEICRGGVHPPGKEEKAKECIAWFERNGVRCEKDRDYGKADLVARHRRRGTLVVEVEGTASKPKSQALYSALGQLLLRKHGGYPEATYGLAVPNDLGWKKQLGRIPLALCTKERLSLYLVDSKSVDLYE